MTFLVVVVAENVAAPVGYDLDSRKHDVLENNSDYPDSISELMVRCY
jgi:hypothetical protein